jgi:hypothetical protein
MNLAKSSAVLLKLILVCALSANAQEIPKGVNYKRAPDGTNAAAQSALQAALASESTPEEFTADVFVCGPMLWKSLEPSADKVLREAKPVVAIIQGREPVTAVGKTVLTPEQHKAFWPLLLNVFPDLRTATIRKAHADEISFYWAEIPFDIEEPFFVVETKSERFIVNISMRIGHPVLFWIDRVGDFGTLKH